MNDYISAKLRKLRRDKKYSIHTLSRLLENKNQKYSLQTIYKWEEGTILPNIYALKALSEIYECSISYLISDQQINIDVLNTRERILLNFFRNDNNFIKKNNVFILFFIQLFFISASYYFCFYGGFLYINNAVKCIFSVKKDSNPFIWVIIYFISFILFICAVPVILISLPYFPIFTSIFN